MWNTVDGLFIVFYSYMGAFIPYFGCICTSTVVDMLYTEREHYETTSDSTCIDEQECSHSCAFPCWSLAFFDRIDKFSPFVLVSRKRARIIIIPIAFAIPFASNAPRIPII